MRSPKGFTLMEVLVALAVSGICLAVVFQAFSQSTRLRAKAESVMDAAHVLRELVDQPGFIRGVLERRGGSGRVPGTDDWVFEAIVEPVMYVPEGTNQERELADMVAVTVCVRGSSGEGGRRCITGWYPALF